MTEEKYEAKEYSVTVYWSRSKGEYRGYCQEIPDVGANGKFSAKVVHDVLMKVQKVIEENELCGFETPEPNSIQEDRPTRDDILWLCEECMSVRVRSGFLFLPVSTVICSDCTKLRPCICTSPRYLRVKELVHEIEVE